MKSDPQTRYARNGGVSLAYSVVGDGPLDMLYIPGYIANVELAFDHPRYAGLIRQLAAFGRVILMDRRGTGCSDRFSPEDLPPLETLIEDARVVLDEVGSEATALVSFEAGGSIAALFAATYPQRTSALVLYGWNPCGTATEDYPWQYSAEEWAEYFTKLRAGWGAEEYYQDIAGWVAPSILHDDALVRWWARFLRLSASPSAAEALERLQSQTDMRNILPSVHVPTLVLHRVGDPTEPIEAARYAAARIPGARLVELEGSDSPPWAGDTDALVAEIEEFLTGTRHPRSTARQLTTLLFTDIVDSTAMAADLGDQAWSERIATHERIARGSIDRFGGRFVDSTGDSLLATFDGPARAVRCAFALADALAPFGMRIRAGVHTGEVELLGERVGGLGVHIGARVSALAGPSEVLVSSTVKDLVAGSGLTFEDAGEHELKGVPERWHLYRATS